ncbi:hypothetical protein ACQEU6_35410 [Spirillospora sp. CA-108201]
MLPKIATTALALALSASGLVLTPTAATAAPGRALAAPGFNASGIYTIFQSRGGNVQVNVTQDGGGRRLSGITFDLNHPSSQATWSTTRTF